VDLSIDVVRIILWWWILFCGGEISNFYIVDHSLDFPKFWSWIQHSAAFVCVYRMHWRSAIRTCRRNFWWIHIASGSNSSNNPNGRDSSVHPNNPWAQWEYWKQQQQQLSVGMAVRAVQWGHLGNQAQVWAWWPPQRLLTSGESWTISIIAHQLGYRTTESKSFHHVLNSACEISSVVSFSGNWTFCLKWRKWGCLRKKSGIALASYSLELRFRMRARTLELWLVVAIASCFKQVWICWQKCINSTLGILFHLKVIMIIHGPSILYNTILEICGLVCTVVDQLCNV
jgi:hypothetical protein